MAYITVTRYMPVYPVSRKPTGKKYPVSTKKLAKIGRMVFNFVGDEIMGKSPRELALEDLTVDLISAPKGSISGQHFEVTVIVASEDAARLFTGEDGLPDKAKLDTMADSFAMRLARRLPEPICFHVWIRALGLTGYYRFEDGRL